MTDEIKSVLDAMWKLNPRPALFKVSPDLYQRIHDEVPEKNPGGAPMPLPHPWPVPFTLNFVKDETLHDLDWRAAD